MAPLSLYQSIIDGNIIIDKRQQSKKIYQRTQKALDTLLTQIENENENENESDDNKNAAAVSNFDDANHNVQEYGKHLLQRFIKSRTKLHINKQEILSKITMRKLKERFIEEDGDKNFKDYSKALLDLQGNGDVEINNAHYFRWILTDKDRENLLGEAGWCTSKVMKCSNGVKFFCQMNIRRNYEQFGRMSLVLHKIPKDCVDKKVKINFDLFNKSMKKFYVRFGDITLHKYKGVAAEDNRQGVSFEMDLVRNVKENKQIEWEISIVFVQEPKRDSNNDKKENDVDGSNDKVAIARNQGENNGETEVDDKNADKNHKTNDHIEDSKDEV